MLGVHLFACQSAFGLGEVCTFGVRLTSGADFCRNNKADSVGLQRAEKRKIEIDTEGG